MPPLFVTKYSPETIKSLTFTGLAGGFCCLILSRRIVLEFFSMFGNWPIIDVRRSNRLIQLLWVPGHVGIYGNEMADSFAKSSSNIILPPLATLPWTDFTPLLRRYITCLWFNYWNNLPAHFA
ncbi:RNase H domain-containing protein [Aphis craccivora]|uniref:RNase H domain-containing protein n=1 Tax=Aphis craccivora TaxID=307492 RepID=A0A6G0WLC0_APHCR|nr:RNase H domain-containing protein [Aphis craccivora]